MSQMTMAGFIAEDDELAFPNRTHSVSSASACSLALLWRDRKREVRMPRPDRFISADQRAMGSALHAAAEDSLKILFDTGKYPDPEVTFTNVLQRDKLGHLVDRLGEGAGLMQKFHAQFDFNADDRIGSEVKVALTEDGQVIAYDARNPNGVRGKIDWAEVNQANRLRVIDFKNRPALFSQAELKLDMQLSLYAWILGEHYPSVRKVPAELGIYYFQWGITDVVEMSWAEIDANVARLRDRMRAKARLKVIDVQPEPGFGRCQYCDHLGDCPDGLAAMSDTGHVAVDQASALRLAKTIFVVEEFLSAAKDGLKEFCKEHGAIRIDSTTGFAFTLHEGEEIKVGMSLLKLLKKHDIEFSDVLKVDLKSMRSMLKQKVRLKTISQEVADSVEAMVVPGKNTMTFKAYRPEKAGKRTRVFLEPMVKEKIKSTPGSPAIGDDVIKKKSRKKK